MVKETTVFAVSCSNTVLLELDVEMARACIPVTPDGATFGDLETIFRERFPGIRDDKLAAIIAQFLEEIPFAAAMTDDGILAPLHDSSAMPSNIAAVLNDLKETAGDAYPYFQKQMAS
jgi:hypothetical protein